MNLLDYDNSIFIVKDGAKKSLLKRINSLHKLINIKIITLSELKKKYYFDYTKKTIFMVSKKYNVISDIAKIYINSLYYIKDIDNEKVKFLNGIMEYLVENKLLKTNSAFHSYLKNKTIILYELENVDLFYRNIFDEFKKDNSVIEFQEDSHMDVKSLYAAKNKEEEIAFVASKIVNLIRKGIDINKILLANVQSDYHYVIRKTFKEFNIPIELPNNSSINGTLIVKKFKELFSNNLENSFEELKSYIEDASDEMIYSKLIDIVNDYAWCDQYDQVKDMIYKDIESTLLPCISLKNAVRTIDFTSDIIEDDEYVFLINFNEGIIPVNHKNEDFLNDIIKEKLHISTSVDLNIKEIKEIKKRIRNTQNLIVSYSKYDITSELYISNAYDEEILSSLEVNIDYTTSDAYNKLRLISAKDEYKRYGNISDELVILDNHYNREAYCSFNNNFKGILPNKIKDYIGNKLMLSYTSMDTFYLCGFRYYLDYILKMDKFEDNFGRVIGTIFHEILSLSFNDDFDFDKVWGMTIEKENYEFNDMEKFFLNNLKEELVFVIDTIKKQWEYTSLKKALYEKEIVIPIDEEQNIFFKGYIDKILYDDFNGERVAIVIDYKTGNKEVSIENIPNGINMQLPIYIYLLKHSIELKDAKIGGFYIQKILNNITDMEGKIDSLKLQGYSNSDVNILEKVDSSFMNSKVIKSLKTTSNGFSSYAKVLSDEEMNKISILIGNKIKEASNKILDADFSINPKEIDGKLEGCKFCKYNDICYMKNADIVKLKHIPKEELLGGVENA